MTARAVACGLALLLSAGSLAAQTALSVTVIGDPRDPRAAAVQEAVGFWNEQLAHIGAGVRLGPV
ncbi:MAG TPA: hypothetical protein VKG23_01660, partial [Thermoanaerobaculia bacterium]|nr:hypothetical protein [Thermoanaerobaculia bacterium]